MIKLHYAHVDNEDDIPCYDIENKDSLLTKIYELVINNKKVVMLICFDGEVYVSSNPAYIYSVVDEMFEANSEDDDGSPFCDNVHLQEYKSFEAAYGVALMMKEQDELCYEPD